MKQIPSSQRTRGAGVMALSLLLVGCVSFGVDSYEEFRSAVDSGATCEQLFDIQRSFEDSKERARIEQDLNEIGCESPSSTRTDN